MNTWSNENYYPRGYFCHHFGSLGIVTIIGFVARFSRRSAPQDDSLAGAEM